MDYTSIHIYGHLLSDDILHNIERDNTLNGNRDQDFGMDISVSSAIDYVWSSLRNDWNFYKERANNERLVNKDPYGTRRARDLMERLFQSLGYSLDRQATNIEVAGTNYDISYTCHDLGKMPFVMKIELNRDSLIIKNLVSYFIYLILINFFHVTSDIWSTTNHFIFIVKLIFLNCDFRTYRILIHLF